MIPPLFSPAALLETCARVASASRARPICSSRQVATRGDWPSTAHNALAPSATNSAAVVRQGRAAPTHDRPRPPRGCARCVAVRRPPAETGADRPPRAGSVRHGRPRHPRRVPGGPPARHPSFAGAEDGRAVRRVVRVRPWAGDGGPAGTASCHAVAGSPQTPAGRAAVQLVVADRARIGCAAQAFRAGRRWRGACGPRSRYRRRHPRAPRIPLGGQAVEDLLAGTMRADVVCQSNDPFARVHCALLAAR